MAFIEPAKYEDLLNTAMIDAYQKLIGRDYSPTSKKLNKF